MLTVILFCPLVPNPPAIESFGPEYQSTNNLTVKWNTSESNNVQNAYGNIEGVTKTDTPGDGVTTGSLTFDGLVPGTSYTVYLWAKGPAGKSSQSNQTSRTYPAQPSGLEASNPTTESFDLTWTQLGEYDPDGFHFIVNGDNVTGEIATDCTGKGDDTYNCTATVDNLSPPGNKFQISVAAQSGGLIGQTAPVNTYTSMLLSFVHLHVS